jgi:UDPglucose 6-dehydrogenase
MTAGSSERVVIVGGGVVGAATASALSGIGHSVSIVEISPERREILAAEGFEVVQEPGDDLAGAIVLLSVPTPADADGYDLGLLRSAARSAGRALSGQGPGAIVVVRSTVPPGTTSGLVADEVEAASGLRRGEGFHVASAPEFLRAATAREDATHPWMTVLGCEDAASLDRLESAFQPLGGALRSFSDPATAEAIKIVHNCFNAAKISFFNEVSDVCAAIGVDGDAVAEVVVRSAEASTNPDYGTKGGRPFDGACLPKDLNGLIAFAEEHDVEALLLRAVREVNLHQAERG